jgi:Rha family phage regulatory protein
MGKVERMKNEIAVVEKIKVFERDGKQWTTSLNVADVFGTPHDEVLKRIRNCQCSEGFRLVNFHESNYLNSQNKSMPMYEMTRDGFSFLVMGFTGSKAAQFKEAYIEAFNRMEEQIKSQMEINERHLVVSEKFQLEVIAMNKKNQEILDKIAGVVVETKESVNEVKEDVSNIKKRVETLENHVNNKKKQPTKTTRETHLEFVYSEYNGACPICKTQIVRINKVIKENFVVDHKEHPNEPGLEFTWGICKKCNSDKKDSKIEKSVLDACFNYYQMRLKQWNIEISKQIPLV